jgi:hypothetical protein
MWTCFKGLNTDSGWKVANKQEKMREFDLFPIEEFVRWVCFRAHRGEWSSEKEVQSHLLGNREPCGLVW